MNLHDIVRGAITQVNPDESGTMFVSTGRTNVRGILTPTFSSVNAQLQIQAQKHTPLQHERGALYTNSFLTIYAYGKFDDLSRPLGKGGDFAAFRGGWWYITQFLEWWPDWCAFEVTQQLNAANIETLLSYLQNGANLPAGLPPLPPGATTTP